MPSMPAIDPLEKLIIKLKKKKTIEVIIERPQGYIEKSGWEPYPFNYGFVKGTFNPVDQEDFDAIVLNYPVLNRDDEVVVEIKGILMRDDKDHKIIGIKPGSKISEDQLCEINNWYSEWFSGVKIEIWND